MGMASPRLQDISTPEAEFSMQSLRNRDCSELSATARLEQEQEQRTFVQGLRHDIESHSFALFPPISPRRCREGAVRGAHAATTSGTPSSAPHGCGCSWLEASTRTCDGPRRPLRSRTRALRQQERSSCATCCVAASAASVGGDAAAKLPQRPSIHRAVLHLPCDVDSSAAYAARVGWGYSPDLVLPLPLCQGTPIAILIGPCDDIHGGGLSRDEGLVESTKADLLRGGRLREVADRI
mmetsp:Transcript_32278/g.48699  ORF Transcript_32278/g.48699 Transcript_32278/m.48699 type:complete len:238 (-) Transcript_32278:158-871(-)